MSLFFAVKPTFAPGSLVDYTVIEGETKNLSLLAKGNPPEIQYSWEYPDSVAQSRVKASKHVFILDRAERTDAGNYSVTAINSYGDFKTTVAVKLDVLFPPS